MGLLTDVSQGYLDLTWTSTGAANAYNYQQINNTQWAGGAIATGDFIEYEVFHVQGASMALDADFSGGGNLRDSGAVDQNGYSAHPGTVFAGGLAAGSWYARRISLASKVGQTVTRWMFASEGDAATTYQARFRNIRVTNSGAGDRKVYVDDTPNSPPTAPTYTTSLIATTVLSTSSRTLATYTQPSISPQSAYGSRAYGGGAPVSAPRAGLTLASTAAGVSTVTFGMSTIKRSGDITAIAAPTGGAPAGQPSDIILEPQQGPNTLASGPAGAATVTMGQGERYTVSAAPAGVAAPAINMGVRYRTLTTSNGQGGAKSLGIFTGSWYLGSPWHIDSIAVARAGCLSNILTVYSGAVFTSRVFVYPSTTPPDVNLAPESGPGTTKSMVSTNQGVGHMTASMGGLAYLVINSAGRAGVRDQFGTAGKWYLGSPFHIDSLAAGRGGARDLFGSTGQWYLGSPFHIISTMAGRGGARDQFGSAGFWYLGSPLRITSTSAGRGGCNRNYVSSAIFQAATANGVGHLTAYLGSPFHITSTMAGRATMVATRLAGTARISMTSNGAGGGVNYLSSPFRVSMTSAGRAGGTIYLGSPFHVFSTAAGKGGGIIYLGSRVYMAGTSPGRAATVFYQGGTFLLPNITMRGVGHWQLGPIFLNNYFVGVGHMNDVHLAGTQRQAAVSHGVGNFHDNDEFLYMVSNGSSRGTEFDKPPFALVCNAGCRAYQGFAQRIDSGITYSYNDYLPFGVFMYMSAPIRFGNHDSNIEGRGNASMAGRSTFTFPYEMVAISNAGCRAFTTYRADDNPYIFLASGQSHTPGGVFARQTSPDYMYATTNTYIGYYPPNRAYMSSRVYYEAISRGRSAVAFHRIQEADFHGVGGGTYTLGVDHRQLVATSHGVGDWRNNYLPDIRLLRMRSTGVGHASAYQVGFVHFDSGDVTSHGIGTFFIDPGLMVAASHGIGHVNDIQRPDAVFMQWGLGEFFYSRRFPVISPLLIPKSSSGIAYVRIEIDQAPVIQNDINGVAGGSLTQEGIEKPMRWAAYGGSYPWIQEPPDPLSPGQERHVPYDGGNYVPSYYSNQIVHRQGVEVAFTPVEVVWQPNGVGGMRTPLRLHYALVWDQGNNEYFNEALEQYLPTGQHPSVFNIGRGSGGRGHFYFRGPRQVQSIAYARARDTFDMSARFSNLPIIAGISTALFDFTGATGKVAEYGNMLAIHFSIPHPPAHGQFWPRRFRYGTVPV